MAWKILLFSLLLTHVAYLNSKVVSSDILSIEDDILKPSNVERQYKALMLSNGMKVVLISDKERTGEASMALDVNVGYLHSPKNAPYLASLLARTLLVASWPKFNQESRTSEYVSSSDGLVTSKTNADHTVFDFKEILAPLDEILKKFSDQLVSPQISMDQLERAIWEFNYDREFDFYMYDIWRLETFLRSRADPSHDYYADNLMHDTPNILKNETINKMALFKEMIQFYNVFYSANLMTLAIVSDRNMTDMINLVVPLFARVPNKILPTPAWINHPYGPQQTGYLYHMERNNNNPHIELIVLFPIPEHGSSNFLSKPWYYVIYAITGKGRRSLTAVLKDRGLVTKQLRANVETVAEGIGFFKISCYLTKKGQENVQEVIHLIIEYINYLKSQAPQEWIHREAQKEWKVKMNNIQPRWDYVEELAMNMHKVPAKYYVISKYMMPDYQPELIVKVLSYLRPDNVNAYVWTKSIIGKPGKIEKFFEKNCTVERMTETIRFTDGQKNINFTLPVPDPYLSSQISIIDITSAKVPLENVSAPRIIHESVSSRIWHLQDHAFKQHAVFLHFKFLSPATHTSLSNYAASVLHNDLLYNVLLKHFKKAHEAELFEFSNYYSGYGFRLSENADKIQDFATGVAKFMVSSKYNSQELFNQCKTKRTERLRSGFFSAESLEDTTKWTSKELLDSIRNIRYEQIELFQQEFFGKLHIEMFSYGNINKEDTLKTYNEVLKVIQKRFSSEPASLAEIEKPKIVVLPKGRQFIFKSVVPTRPKRILAARSLYQFIPFEKQPEHLSIASYKITSCVVEKINDEIRKQSNDLKSSIRNQRKGRDIGVNFGRFFIKFWVYLRKDMSDSPEELDLAMEAHIKLLQAKLTEMNTTRIATLKNSCMYEAETNTPFIFNSMKDVADYYWDKISRDQSSFDKTPVVYDAMKGISKDDIISCFKQLLSADSPNRRKFAYYFYRLGKPGTTENFKGHQEFKNVTYVTSIKAFKSSLPSFDDGDDVSPIMIMYPVKIRSSDNADY